MGQFSWFTQDTHERIINDKPMHVVMCDDKGNKYVEECYEGYGVFGGKDFYELVAEMNGYKIDEINTSYHPGTPFHIRTHGRNPYRKQTIKIRDYWYKTLEEAKEKLRLIGIDMAFDGYPCGDNPNIIYPSLTTRGWYCNGECPESDPDQGFPMEDMYDEDYDEE